MLFIDEVNLNEMIADAIAMFPEECCGFFFGIDDGKTRIVKQSLSVPNSSKQNKQKRFEIRAEDYLKAESHAEQHNIQLLGVYHSHPNHLSQPSSYDLAVAQPNFSYIIISVINGAFAELSCWALNDKSEFEKEEIITRETKSILTKQ